MMRMNRWLALAGLGLATLIGASQGLAQDNNNGGGRGGDNGGGGRGRGFGGGGGGRGNFDPAQFQQMRLERLHDDMEVKDETEWKAIEPLITKVMDAQRDAFTGMGRGMFRGFRGGGGGGGGSDTGGDNGGRRRGGFGEPSPEAEALQKAVEAKASNAELKAALAKYNESVKAKRATLEKAQAELRKVLSVKQEAVATLNGLL
jgi:hypothetical protein